MLLTTRYSDGGALKDAEFIFAFFVKNKNEGEDGYWYSLPEILTNNLAFNSLMNNNDNLTINLALRGAYVLPDISSLDKRDESKEDNYIVFEDLTDEESTGDEDCYTLQQLKDEGVDSEKLSTLISTFDLKITNKELFRIVEDSLECLKNIVNNNFKYTIMSASSFRNYSNKAQIEKVLNNYNDNSFGEEIDYIEKKKTEMRRVAQTDETSQLTAFVPRNLFYYDDSNEFREELKLESEIDRTKWSILENTPLINPYGDISEPVNSLNFRSVLKNVPEKYITGDSENNDLPIQENEEAFYNSLNLFITRYIKSFADVKGVSPDIYLKNWTAVDYLLDVLSTYMSRFVQENWSHCYKIPFERGASSGVSTDDNSSVEEVDSVSNSASEEESRDKYVIPENKLRFNSSGSLVTNEAFIDYIETFKNFLISNNCSVYAISELIVKLARWGKRKPESIILNAPMSESTQKYELDLESFEIILSDVKFKSITTSPDKKLRLLGLMVEPEGNITLTEGLTYDNNKPDETELYQQLDILGFESNAKFLTGLVCVQEFEAQNIDMTRLLLLDLSYITSQYIAGKELIEGLNYTDGKFSIDNSIIDVSSLSEYTLNDKFELFRSSQKKAKYSFMNDSINISNLLNVDINMSKDEWKSTSLTGTIKDLLDTDKSSTTKIISYLLDGNRLEYSHLKMFLLHTYINYIVDVTADGISDFVEQLNLFSLKYSSEVIPNISTIKMIESVVEEEQNLSKTNMFTEEPKEVVKEKETLVVLHKFTVDNTEFCVVQSRDKNLTAGCNGELLIKNKDLYNFAEEKMQKNLAGLSAQMFIFTLAIDTSHKNGIFVSDDVKNKIIEIKNSIYGEAVSIPMLIAKIKEQVSKR